MMISECITHIGPNFSFKVSYWNSPFFREISDLAGLEFGFTSPNSNAYISCQLCWFTRRKSLPREPQSSWNSNFFSNCRQFDPECGTTTSPNLATFCNVSHKKRSSYVNFHLLRVHRVDEVRHDSWPLGLPFISSFVVDWGSLPQKRHRDFKFRKYRLWKMIL